MTYTQRCQKAFSFWITKLRSLKISWYSYEISFDGTAAVVGFGNRTLSSFGIILLTLTGSFRWGYFPKQPSDSMIWIWMHSRFSSSKPYRLSLHTLLETLIFCTAPQTAIAIVYTSYELLSPAKFHEAYSQGRVNRIAPLIRIGWMTASDCSLHCRLVQSFTLCPLPFRMQYWSWEMVLGSPAN